MASAQLTEHVVEVDDVPLALLGLVRRVYARHLARRPRWPTVRGFGRTFVAVRPDETGLRPLDLGRDVGDRDRCRRPSRAQDRAQDAGLAFEDARRFPVAFGGVAAELRQCDRVKGAGRDPAVDAEATDTRYELPGRLAREGDREDVLRLHPAFPRAVRDATREYPRLARAGRRDDREWRRVGGDRVVLARIEVVEQHVAHPRHGTQQVGRPPEPPVTRYRAATPESGPTR